jgi:hypothetical protein
MGKRTLTVLKNVLKNRSLYVRYPFKLNRLYRSVEMIFEIVQTH